MAFVALILCACQNPLGPAPSSDYDDSSAAGGAGGQGGGVAGGTTGNQTGGGGGSGGAAAMSGGGAGGASGGGSGAAGMPSQVLTGGSGPANDKACGRTMVPMPSQNGQEFFVASNAPANADGSMERPFPTLQRACQVASAGDTITVRGGTYRQRETATCAGEAGKPVLVRAMPGEKPIFDGNGVAMGRYDAQIALWQSHDLIFDGIEIKGSTGFGINCGDCERVLLRNLSVHDMRWQAIVLSGDDISLEDSHIYNVVMDNSNPVPNWTGGVASWSRTNGSPSTNINFRRNRIHDVWGECLIELLVTGGEVTDNVIFNCLSANVYIDNAKNIDVKRNYLYCTSNAYTRPDIHIRGPGVQVALEPASQYNGLSNGPAENINITNNLILGTGHGFRVWRDGRNSDASNAYRNVRFAYNVVKDVTQVPVQIDAFPTPTSSNEVRNNILFKGARGDISIASNAGWTFSNNDWPNGVPANAAGEGNFAADPKFDNPVIGGPAAGFKVGAGSPVIGKGRAVGFEAGDFWCGMRKGPPSVGFHEP